jgi:hypothetical protein
LDTGGEGEDRERGSLEILSVLEIFFSGAQFASPESLDRTRADDQPGCVVPDRFADSVDHRTSKHGYNIN